MDRRPPGAAKGDPGIPTDVTPEEGEVIAEEARKVAGVARRRRWRDYHDAFSDALWIGMRAVGMFRARGIDPRWFRHFVRKVMYRDLRYQRCHEARERRRHPTDSADDARADVTPRLVRPARDEAAARCSEAFVAAALDGATATQRAYAESVAFGELTLAEAARANGVTPGNLGNCLRAMRPLVLRNLVRLTVAESIPVADGPLDYDPMDDVT